MTVACSEAGVKVATRSEAGVEAVACSKVEDEATTCSGPGIEDGRRRQHDSV
jgi:hypothetical protein